MFYFDDYKGQKVLKSDYLRGISAFFTTRDTDMAKIITSDSNSVHPEQTHSGNVEVTDDRTEYPNTDALITNQRNKTIYLKFADCTPIIFYDPINNTGAVTHAGWRGTAARIGVKTVNKMVSEFHSKPYDIIAVIGAAIGLCCYEVSDDVKEKLISTVKNSTGLYSGSNVDLKGINARQLEEIGVHKIDVCPYCTSCNNDLFYSYRKENGTASRHYAVLKL